jgi:asparagine synthase (glutamine-hydrolysing)
MCGIFGLIGNENQYTVNADVVDKCHTALNYRGPDNSGIYRNNFGILGHNRLSIIDTSLEGNQPFIDKTTDTVLIANGEIYNYKKVRKELNMHFKFNSQSDSEVLLYGYIYWGIDGLLERLDGIFAFAVLDNRADKVFLVRDHYGVKPLYFSRQNEGIIFGSELKVIETVMGNNLVLDNEAVYDYLTYGFIPTPKSLYKNVNKIEPGTYIEYNYKADSIKKSCYYSLKKDVPFLPKKDTEIRESISTSVRAQLVSDVPVGLFLSGGLDSSVLLYEMQKYIKDFKAFTLSFPGSRQDESFFARESARKYGIDHDISPFSEEDYHSYSCSYAEIYDEPHSDTGLFSFLKLSQRAHEDGRKVILSGDGGDELYFGYKRYFEFMRVLDSSRKDSRCIYEILKLLGAVNFWRVRNFSKKFIKNYIPDEVELYALLKHGMLRHQKDGYRNKLEIDSDYDDYWYYRRHYDNSLPIRKRLQYMDIMTVLHDDYLTKVDRASMRNSIEVRVPLLAKRNVEFCWRSDLFDNKVADSKMSLRQAYSSILAASVRKKNKSGFSIPQNRVELRKFQNLNHQEIVLNKYWPEIYKIIKDD